jgi:hypothetical protein
VRARASGAVSVHGTENGISSGAWMPESIAAIRPGKSSSVGARRAKRAVIRRRSNKGQKLNAARRFIPPCCQGGGPATNQQARLNCGGPLGL